MNVLARLAGFAVVLGVAFGGAALAGAAIDPTSQEPVAAHAGHEGGMASAGAADTPGDGHGSMGAMERTGASGLAVSLQGLTLDAARTLFTTRKVASLRFRIIDARGRALRDDFQVESARRLHLIVVRRDTGVYQHLHPTEAPDGTWSVDVTLPEAGVYRAYADFQVGGAKHVLAIDLFASGNFAPSALPAASWYGQARLDGTQRPAGERVRLRAPGLKAGRETVLTFAVSRDSQPVRDLQPYLGAKGHLVALREGDLAYLHVHPDEAKLAVNQIQFMSSFPTAGTYRLFLQFQRDGAVRTVAYTLKVPR